MTLVSRDKEAGGGMDFRETTVRVHGVERVVRTGCTGTVRQLEASHTKAVKAALIEMRKACAPVLREKARKLGEGRDGRVTQLAGRWERGVFTNHGTYDVATMRKPFPKMPSGGPVPEYLREIGPGEYATAEAAASMGATECPDEVLPGLAVCRTGKGWTLNILSDASDKHPQGRSTGALFKTRKRACEVALADLVRFDWTRSAEELLADAEIVAIVTFVRLREFVAASKRNAWAKGDLRKAWEEVARISLDVADI